MINNIRYKIDKNVIYYEFDNNSNNIFLNNSFKIEYPLEYDLNNCNELFLKIPVQSLLIMMCSIFHLKLDVGNILKSYYKSILKILDIFSDMYNDINFDKDIDNVQIDIDNKIDYNKKILYFSGGIDAYSSLYTHYEERPLLFMVDGINNGHIKNLNDIEMLNLDICYVKTDIRNIINEKYCGNYLHIKNPKHTFWNRYLQSVVFTALCSPIIYLNKISKIYYASTYDYRFTKVQYSSLPHIDNNIRMNNCYVIHDGYEFTRIEKVKRVLNFLDKFNNNTKNISVCFRKRYNCCNCYKCVATILAILSEGKDPKKYGFLNRMDTKNILNIYSNINFYNDIYLNFLYNNINPPKELVKLLSIYKDGIDIYEDVI